MLKTEKCEKCGVPKGEYIFRCFYENVECYQTGDGNLYAAENSELLAINTEFYDLIPITKDKAMEVILVKGLCQKCYNQQQHKLQKEKNESQIPKLF